MNNTLIASALCALAHAQATLTQTFVLSSMGQ